MTSLLLLVGASIGVLAVARALLPHWPALAVALLFAVHPVHVDAVAAAVGQNELLVGLFSVTAVALYVRARLSSHQPKALWAGLGLLYAGASLAKEQGLLLPALLLAAELTVIRASGKIGPPTQWRTGAVTFGLIGALVLAARTYALGGQLAPPAAADALQGATMAGRALTMLGVVPEWLRLLAWPQRLLIEYRAGDYTAAQGWGTTEVAGLLLLAMVSAIAWWSRRTAPVVTFGVLWMAITLFPVTNVLLPTYILLAERTLFMPSVGFLMMMGGAVTALGHHYPNRLARLGPVAAGGAMFLVVLGGIRSAVRYQDWRSHDILIAATLRDSPRNWNALAARGDIFFDRGQYGPAVTAYQNAIVWAPERWEVRLRFARRLQAIRADAAAVEQLELALADRPGDTEIMVEYLPGLLVVGRYERARSVADSIIGVEGAAPALVWLRTVADSAHRIAAPVGSVRINLRGQ